jgi:crotonobetaine/carnitine-CoA ligase
MENDPGRWLDYSIRDLTVNSVLARQALFRGDKEYIRTAAGERLTYAETHRITNRIANWLIARGFKRGSHIAVFMENELECLLSHIAITKIGAVCVPVNANANGGMLAHYLNFSDSVAVIVTPEFARRVIMLEADLAKVDTLIVVGDLESPGCQRFTVLPFPANEDASEEPVPEGVKFSDVAFIMFTSGTTGPSKGVMFPHARAFMWDEGVIQMYDISAEDRYFICTPLSHATGLFSGAWTMMAVGGSVGLTQRFSASQFWDQVRATGATYTTLLGAMVSFLEGVPEQQDDANNPMRLISAAPYPATWESFERRFGVRLSIAYGLSDHSVATRLPMDAPAQKRGSTGRVIEGFELIVVDEDDIPLLPGKVGEVLIRSRVPWHSSLGYYKLAEQTVHSRRHEWFHTGDRGYLDDDGYFWFVDRAKDAIRRLGENISSFEVEQYAGRHPEVAEIAAYPLAADKSEQEVAVSVVLKANAAFHPRDLVRFCMQTMPKFMVPRFVHVADSLPRNLNQRVEKYKLREWAEKNRAALWDRESEPEFRRAPGALNTRAAHR